ncbi:MAG TPA: bifunctional 4-hydroxy-2-oxoglutarate aldolase/2-dehydro-3-deoxy-phosphogluconate aldolase [Chthoniobacteraceae bacterium]|jgi:2-dehydro-3-deoxyphosphogluconate aldolase/(4S)-4-hydroxy-2-oxoglutarate aldolase|nr:bifunctional 4-hydroxy-2-oxoglutarate aldolase/2-dehydro-3-deoxy-phosphogluconate aldolase [Chthoniobacteraceae bacterium]
MTKSEIIPRLLDPGIVAILRAESTAGFTEVADALYAGGVRALEVTMTTPGVLDCLSELAARFEGRMLIGVGSVIEGEACRTAILSGAEFVVTPVTKSAVIRIANHYGKPIASGAYTPTEALAAHEMGADFIKIFPADLGGPAFIKNILAPLPMLRIIPTGGVTPETAGDFLRAGSVALGAGSTLVNKDALKRGDWAAITARAKEFVDAVSAARAKG